MKMARETKKKKGQINFDVSPAINFIFLQQKCALRSAKFLTAGKGKDSERSACLEKFIAPRTLNLGIDILLS